MKYKKKNTLVLKNFYIRPDQDNWLDRVEIEGCFYRADKVRLALDILRDLLEKGSIRLEDLPRIHEIAYCISNQIIHKG